MSEEKVYDVPAPLAQRAYVDDAKYRAMYERSVKDPDGFWADQAREFLTWFKPWTKVSDWSFDTKNLHIKWFEGGKLNVAYNCLDRHLEKRANQVAMIWRATTPRWTRRSPTARCTKRSAASPTS